MGKGDIPQPIVAGAEEACLNCGNCTAVCPADAIEITGSYNVPAGRYKTQLLEESNDAGSVKTRQHKT
ncbi:MAG: 4Fe-4S dicluster domain-containing protein [Desulfobacterales bacterium]